MDREDERTTGGRPGPGTGGAGRQEGGLHGGTTDDPGGVRERVSDEARGYGLHGGRAGEFEGGGPYKDGLGKPDEGPGSGIRDSNVDPRGGEEG